MLSLSPARLFDGHKIVEGATVHIRDGQIAEVTRSPSPAGLKLAGLLAPGFVDVQVNGGGGVLFNDAPTVDALASMAAAHRQFGVTGFMATLISDSRSKIVSALDAVTQAVQSGVEGVLGLHLEGPWLSDTRRGVHPTQYLRTLDAQDLLLLTRARGFPLMITVAPEQVALASIKALTDAGVIVSLGHTAAASEDIEAALAAGASGFTHLFNAMPPLEGRKPGAVGVAFAHRESWAGLILDGIHVHPLSARAAFAAKTARKLMLVSDAMATVGAPDASMSLFGEKISVSGGALRTSAGTLAGAHLDLSGAVRNAVALLGATTEEALRMASLTPAEFLRVDETRGKIAPGQRADLVLLGPALDVQATWIGGRQVH
jgi:N-acetylglucosamine-6-phosphate deacetylase